MDTTEKLEAKFWSALEEDMTMMLGLVGVEESHTRPMTAQMLSPGDGPIWFFTSEDNSIVQNIKRSARAVATFTAKDHDLFAALHGDLSISSDPEMIEQLWNPFVAAWYEGGQEDPALRLLRFDAEEAEIWLNENSLFAGIKMLFGRDPKADYKDKVATVSLK